MSPQTGSRTYGPEAEIADEPRFQTTDLADKGRLQFFYHSPVSELPVRDVTNEQNKGHKTEPYLELNAENYCNKCYQGNNIVPFAKSSERYLFLFTTCRNPDLDQNGERFIVGFLEKKQVLDVDGHYAVQGPIELYGFENAYPLSKLHPNPMDIRMLTLDRRKTNRVLEHFEGVRDIFNKCVEEVNRLKELAGPAAVPPPEQDDIDRGGSTGC